MDDAELQLLRKQLTIGLTGTESHIAFEKVVREFPSAVRGNKPEGAPHSAWQLIEHMRIAQHDILEFSRNPNHQSPNFPEGYWPDSETPPSEAAWEESIKQFRTDARELGQLLEKEELFAAFPHGSGQNLLREAIVLANHNSYHLGQLAFLKRMLVG